MAILSAKRNKSFTARLTTAKSSLAKNLHMQGADAVSGKVESGVLLGLESYMNTGMNDQETAIRQQQVDNFFSHLDAAKANVKSIFKDVFESGRRRTKSGKLGRESAEAEYDDLNEDLNEEEGLTEQQLESGAVAALAAHDPAAYAKAALKVTDDGADVNAAPDIDGTAVAVESYDNSNVTEMLPFSIIYNTLAARQGPLAEAFFPTQVLTPDTSNVAVSITRSVLMNDFRHSDSGRPVDLGRINLADAALDASILSRNATKMVPVYLDTVNDAFFHPDFAPVPAISDGIEVETAPLACDQEFDFIGLCQAGMAHVTGNSDWSDTIANPVYLQTAWFKITAKDGVTSSLVALKLGQQARALFSKKTMGEEMEMGLQFANDQLNLTGDTLDKDGNPAEALAFLRDPANAGRYLQFAAELNGTIFLNKGNGTVNSSKGRVKRLMLNQNGQNNPINDETIFKAMSEEIKSIEFVAFELDANRSNLNRAQRGDLTDTFEEREMYSVGLSTPITAIIPTTDTRTTSDLLGPITATRLRNDNNAITKLYSYSATLEEARISYDKHLPRNNQVEGIARWVMTPFYERATVSVLDMMTNLRSADKVEDIQMSIVNLIREIIYRGYRDSNYETALRMQTGVEGEKPKVLIGTDTVLANHLIIQGDNRLAGLNFESEIFTSVDRRLGEFGQDIHDVFITLTRGIPLDPMSFGTFLWMPELATTLQISREGGRTSNEVMVQPRCKHIVQLPWLIHLTITDLAVALVQKSSIDFNMV